MSAIDMAPPPQVTDLTQPVEVRPVTDLLSGYKFLQASGHLLDQCEEIMRPSNPVNIANAFQVVTLLAEFQRLQKMYINDSEEIQNDSEEIQNGSEEIHNLAEAKILLQDLTTAARQLEFRGVLEQDMEQAREIYENIKARENIELGIKSSKNGLLNTSMQIQEERKYEKTYNAAYIVAETRWEIDMITQGFSESELPKEIRDKVIELESKIDKWSKIAYDLGADEATFVLAAQDHHFDALKEHLDDNIERLAQMKNPKSQIIRPSEERIKELEGEIKASLLQLYAENIIMQQRLSLREIKFDFPMAPTFTQQLEVAKKYTREFEEHFKTFGITEAEIATAKAEAHKMLAEYAPIVCSNETRIININGQDIELRRFYYTQANHDLGIQEGQKGGWIQKENIHNIEGLVGENVIVLGNAKVLENGKAEGYVILCGDTAITGNGLVRGPENGEGVCILDGETQVRDNSIVDGSCIIDGGVVLNDTQVRQDATIIAVRSGTELNHSSVENALIDGVKNVRSSTITDSVLLGTTNGILVMTNCEVSGLTCIEASGTIKNSEFKNIAYAGGSLNLNDVKVDSGTIINRGHTVLEVNGVVPPNAYITESLDYKRIPGLEFAEGAIYKTEKGELAVVLWDSQNGVSQTVGVDQTSNTAQLSYTYNGSGYDIALKEGLQIGAKDVQKIEDAISWLRQLIAENEAQVTDRLKDSTIHASEYGQENIDTRWLGGP